MKSDGLIFGNRVHLIYVSWIVKQIWKSKKDWSAPNHSDAEISAPIRDWNDQNFQTCWRFKITTFYVILKANVWSQMIKYLGIEYEFFNVFFIYALMSKWALLQTVRRWKTCFWFFRPYGRTSCDQPKLRRLGEEMLVSHHLTTTESALMSFSWRKVDLKNPEFRKKRQPHKKTTFQISKKILIHFFSSCVEDRSV